MIRDVRTDYRRSPATASRSLAFSRQDIARAAVVEREAGARTGGALTIAVTSPRSITCKRGFASMFATHLAARVVPEHASVCVIDTDLESRDVGVRFGITTPTLLDVANAVTLRDSSVEVSDVIPRIDPPGVHVLPTRLPQSALVPLLHNKTTALLPHLRAAFDFVVIDAPVTVGLGPFDWERAMLRQVDVLLVAATAEASSLGGVLRYLNALAGAKNNGALPPTFDAHVVLTGRDDDGTRSLLTEADIERKLRGIPVIASVPQLWGRQRPEAALDVDAQASLHREFAAIVDRVTEDQHARGAR
jgi:MinD-like ATPase involved in chromosome partitioning or flagellar assembly